MTTQLALRLPDDLLADLDWLVVRCSYESRTEAMRESIMALVRHERRRFIDQQLVEAYTRLPQSDAELAGIDDQAWDLDGDDDWTELL